MMIWFPRACNRNMVGVGEEDKWGTTRWFLQPIKWASSFFSTPKPLASFQLYFNSLSSYISQINVYFLGVFQHITCLGRKQTLRRVYKIFYLWYVCKITV